MKKLICYVSLIFTCILFTVYCNEQIIEAAECKQVYVRNGVSVVAYNSNRCSFYVSGYYMDWISTIY